MQSYTLYVVDISDPAQPAEIGRFALPFGVAEMIAAENSVDKQREFFLT